jgi:hypothetical protein
LIESWIVPQLIRAFISETVPQSPAHSDISRSCEVPCPASSGEVDRIPLKPTSSGDDP